MNTILAVIGFLAVGGGVSLCDVCDATHGAVAAESAPRWQVRRVLTRLAGVSRVDVTYEPSRAVVAYDPSVVTVAQLVAAIETLGYTATAITPAAT